MILKILYWTVAKKATQSDYISTQEIIIYTKTYILNVSLINRKFMGKQRIYTKSTYGIICNPIHTKETQTYIISINITLNYYSNSISTYKYLCISVKKNAGFCTLEKYVFSNILFFYIVNYKFDSHNEEA